MKEPTIGEKEEEKGTLQRTQVQNRNEFEYQSFSEKLVQNKKSILK